jgi:micrococcal nuclease
MKIRRLLIFLAIILILVDLVYFYPKLTGKGIYEVEIVNVTRVIDGDTLETAEKEKIRLLCINTPEKTHSFYEEAKAHLAKLEGKEVALLRDKTNKDKYDRKLRYVFYKDRFINKELLEEGLANLYLCEGLKYQRDLEKAQNSARKNQEGLWKLSEGACSGCIELLTLSAEEEFFTLKNTCNLDCQAEAKDEANHFFDIKLAGGQEKTFHSEGNVWNNDGDSLFLRDESGLLLYHHY